VQERGRTTDTTYSERTQNSLQNIKMPGGMLNGTQTAAEHKRRKQIQIPSVYIFIRGTGDTPLKYPEHRGKTKPIHEDGAKYNTERYANNSIRRQQAFSKGSQTFHNIDNPDNRQTNTSSANRNIKSYEILTPSYLNCESLRGK
jgi:hypothetical protein